MVFCFKAILSIRYQRVYNFKTYWYLLRGKNMGMLVSPPPPPAPWLGLIIPLATEIPSLNPTVGKAFHTGIEKI